MAFGRILGQFFGLDGQGRGAEVIVVGSQLKSVPNGVVDLGVLPGVNRRGCLVSG